MKFRKKPVVIEAVQLLWSTWSEMCEHAGVGKKSEGKPEGCYVNDNGSALASHPRSTTDVLGLHIPTLEGTMLGVEGDWIIRGVKGELYPCKPDIFEATYAADGTDLGFVSFEFSPEQVKCLHKAAKAYASVRATEGATDGKETTIIDALVRRLGDEAINEVK